MISTELEVRKEDPAADLRVTSTAAAVPETYTIVPPLMTSMAVLGRNKDGLRVAKALQLLMKDHQDILRVES